MPPDCESTDSKPNGGYWPYLIALVEPRTKNSSCLYNSLQQMALDLGLDRLHNPPSLSIPIKSLNTSFACYFFKLQSHIIEIKSQSESKYNSPWLQCNSKIKILSQFGNFGKSCVINTKKASFKRPFEIIIN